MKVSKVCFLAEVTHGASYTFTRNMKDAHFPAPHTSGCRVALMPTLGPCLWLSLLSYSELFLCVARLLCLSQSWPHTSGHFLGYLKCDILLISALGNQEVKLLTAALLKPNRDPGFLWLINDNKKTLSSWSFVTSSRLSLVIQKFLNCLDTMNYFHSSGANPLAAGFIFGLPFLYCFSESVILGKALHCSTFLSGSRVASQEFWVQHILWTPLEIPSSSKNTAV